MYNHTFALGIHSELPISEKEQIKLFKKSGFDGFFVLPKKNTDLSELKNYADSIGMIFQSVHAPFGGSAKMWLTRPEADEAIAELLDCLRKTAAAGVPIMVCHAFIGFKDHSPTKEGIENFGIIVKEAEHLGVKIAFENTEGEEYLFALMNAFRDSPAVGFCLDTGHEMCYNRGRDLLSDFGDRLIATHINDNLGIKDKTGEITFLDDLHLLPFDGIRDWERTARRLVDVGYDGILTFELLTTSKSGRHENDKYMRMSSEEYLAEAYIRACKIAALIDKERAKRNEQPL